MVERILGGILFICIGFFLMIASIKMIFVDNPKAKKLLSEAVYVTTDTVDPANDGKAVIVSAPFKLVEPAYDDEMGLTLDSIRISRKKERTEYESKQNDEYGREKKLVWNQEGGFGGIYRRRNGWRLHAFRGFYPHDPNDRHLERL